MKRQGFKTKHQLDMRLSKWLALIKRDADSDRHCNQIPGTQPRTKDLAFEVRELITALLPSGQPMIDDVARELGMSSRTLRRRLADQGFIYKEIVEDVRHKLALRYLSDNRINLKQVVYLLGYSDQAAFNYAFRRWTGSSPSDHRRKG